MVRSLSSAPFFMVVVLASAVLAADPAPTYPAPSGAPFFTSPGSYMTYLPYCVMTYRPYCSSGCNHYTQDTIVCGFGGDTSKCYDLTLDTEVGESYNSTDPCISVDDLSQYVYCRYNSATQQFCLRSTSQGETCFRPRQIMYYEYYYSNSENQPYYLIFGQGTCNNQTVETAQEAAYYQPLCTGSTIDDNAVDSSSRASLTAGIVSSLTDVNPSTVYNFPLGSTTKIFTLYSYAAAVRFTGKQLCFTWNQKTTSYYSIGGSAEYNDACLTQCVSVTKQTHFAMLTAITKYYGSFQPDSNSYTYFYWNTKIDENTGNGSGDNSAAAARGASAHVYVYACALMFVVAAFFM